MSRKSNISELLSLDSQNMFRILKNFPQQVQEACTIGRNAPVFTTPPVSNEFLVLGMGGSAIGGDLLSSYLSSTPGAGHISIRVNRGYRIPGFINENTNVIASSYSGNTEETITALEEAGKYTSRIICITTGGRIEEIAREKGYPVISIPGGYQPRCAVGYSFFPMLLLLMRSGLLKPEAVEAIEKAIRQLTVHLSNKSAIYSDVESEKNIAIGLAERLAGTIPVIYSAGERLDSVNLRWRCQINENAKNLAFGNLLPEMNHNEVNAWSCPAEVLNRFSVIFMRDVEDNDRVRLRFEALKEVMGQDVYSTVELYGSGEFLLVRMFDLVYLGDWLSYYWALLNGQDPTPIPLINKLKNFLSSH